MRGTYTRVLSKRLNIVIKLSSTVAVAVCIIQHQSRRRLFFLFIRIWPAPREPHTINVSLCRMRKALPGNAHVLFYNTVAVPGVYRLYLIILVSIHTA